MHAKAQIRTGIAKKNLCVFFASLRECFKHSVQYVLPKNDKTQLLRH